ncbi:hypothetical protein JCM4914_75800 [Streptomyces platensis subsp. malvinus]
MNRLGAPGVPRLALAQAEGEYHSDSNAVNPAIATPRRGTRPARETGGVGDVPTLQSGVGAWLSWFKGAVAPGTGG